MVSAVEIERGVERLARALGVWVATSSDLHGLAGLAVTADRCQLLVSAGEREPWASVDALAAALILLGHAAGLRVDVGECPDCDGCKDQYRVGERPNDSTLAKATWSEWGVEFGWFGVPVLDGVKLWWRPCPSCTIDGVQTGRHTLTWEAAIIAARAEPCPCCDGSGDFEDDPEPGCLNCENTGRVCSNDSAREALRVMAHTIAGPEHVAVVGDWCESGNALADFRGEPQGGLGEMVTAWLRGECNFCEGGPAWDSTGREVKCPACHGHGHALGRLDDQVLAMLHEAAEQAERPAAIEVSA